MKLIAVGATLVSLWALPMDKSAMASCCDLVALMGSSIFLYLYTDEEHRS